MQSHSRTLSLHEVAHYNIVTLMKINGFLPPKRFYFGNISLSQIIILLLTLLAKYITGVSVW